MKQNGGYDKILNPVTGRKVNVHSKIGKQIVNNYLKQLGGGKFKTVGLAVIAANKLKNIKEINKRYGKLPVSEQQKNRKNLKHAKNLINTGKISIKDNKITIHDDKLKAQLDNNKTKDNELKGGGLSIGRYGMCGGASANIVNATTSALLLLVAFGFVAPEWVLVAIDPLTLLERAQGIYY